MRFGLHGKILCEIRLVLTNNLQSFFDGTHLSNGVEQKKRVAKGDKVSPLLISVFIADMKYFFTRHRLDVIFYADDMTIGTISRHALQKALKDIAEYCNKNGLTVNIIKAKIMKFRSFGRLAKLNHFYYLSKETEIINKFCYLGVALFTQLSAKPHLDILYKEPLATIASINTKLDRQKNNFESATRLESITYPAGTYGLEIYANNIDVDT